MDNRVSVNKQKLLEFAHSKSQQNNRGFEKEK
jgi:hypothetical protein